MHYLSILMQKLITHTIFRFLPLNKKTITVSSILLIILSLSGCSTHVSRVSIPIKVQSEIDIDTYSNFAVLPFVSEEHSSKLGELPVEIGDDIGEILRSRLARQEKFEIVNKQETKRLMTGEEINEEWLEDTEHLSELGKYFEVKGIIVGSYRFISDTQPRRYYGERYSARHQRYIMDYHDYLQKSYLLSLRVMIIDIDTKDIIWDEAYHQKTAEAHTLGSFVFSQMTPQERTIKELSKRAIADFVREITPHYEQEDRFLIR